MTGEVDLYLILGIVQRYQICLLICIHQQKATTKVNVKIEALTNTAKMFVCHRNLVLNLALIHFLNARHFCIAMPINNYQQLGHILCPDNITMDGTTNVIYDLILSMS